MHEFLSHVGIVKVSRVKWTFFFQSVNFSSGYGNLSFEKHGFLEKKWVFIYFSQKIIISEKNCLQNLILFLKELASCIFYFIIFRFWNLTCDVTAWTILIRVLERSTGSAFRTLNCNLLLVVLVVLFTIEEFIV